MHRFAKLALIWLRIKVVLIQYFISQVGEGRMGERVPHKSSHNYMNTPIVNVFPLATVGAEFIISQYISA